MFGHPQRRRGVFIIEAVATLVVIGFVLTAVWAMTGSYRRVQEKFLAQRRLQLAAEGLMERYRAGDALPGGTTELDGPDGIRFRVACSAGSGDWEGLVRAVVTASADLHHGRRATYRLVGYFERAVTDVRAASERNPKQVSVP